jgi:homoprotocatechuate degradation regulator HpaR
MTVSTNFHYRNLPRLLLKARESVMTYTRPSLRQQGLSDQQWRVLRVLGEQADVTLGLETGRLAKEAFLLGPSLSGVLKRMERDGLLQRKRSYEDARRSVVRVTPAGLNKVQTLSNNIESHYIWMEEQMGAEALQTLYALLDKVIALAGQAPGADNLLEEIEE